MLEGWVAVARASTVEIVAPRDVERAVEVGRCFASGVAVRVVSEPAEARKADVVIALGEAPSGTRWETYLTTLGKLATAQLIVVVPNPRGLLDRLAGVGPSAMGSTRAIAPVLWSIGRVREHVFFGAPTAFAKAASPMVKRRLARWHAFSVDTTPRTPQARRKLQTVAE
jgi:hypothetical protein